MCVVVKQIQSNQPTLLKLKGEIPYFSLGHYGIQLRGISVPKSVLHGEIENNDFRLLPRMFIHETYPQT